MLPVAYSSVIHSDSYPVFEDFAEAIRHSWADEWASAYNHESKMEKLKDFEPSERTIRSKDGSMSSPSGQLFPSLSFAR